MGETAVTVVGIDLSGVSRGTKGRTAGARLRSHPSPILDDLRTFPPKVATDRLLVEWVTDAMPSVVAIDAPLSLPHSVGCQVRDCPRCVVGAGEYIARDVDRMARGMPTVMLAAIAFRGMHLARVLRDLGVVVIETYPGAAYRAWSWPQVSRADILQARVDAFLAGSADECDAVAAALVASDHARGRAVALEGADGTIWLPAAD